MNEMVAPSLPQVGDIAPAIALPDDTGSLRDLTHERCRWVVLFFYPKDDTPGCTIEAKQFRDEYAAFEERDAVIWGISKLDSASKAAFKAKCGLPFPLLADEDHDVSRRYGVWVAKVNYGRTSMGIHRATFLVDPEGRIARVWASVTPDGHAVDVLARLDSLRASRSET